MPKHKPNVLSVVARSLMGRQRKLLVMGRSCFPSATLFDALNVCGKLLPRFSNLDGGEALLSWKVFSYLSPVFCTLAVKRWVHGGLPCCSINRVRELWFPGPQEATLQECPGPEHTP